MALVESDSELAVGDPAPSFSLPATNGKEHGLSDYTDYQALLVVFTCNHCPYAKAKEDELNYLSTHYSDLAVVAVNPNDATEYPEDSFSRMKERVANDELRYTAYLRDETQEVARSYGAVCTPDPFLCRRQEVSRASSFEIVFHSRIDDATSPNESPSRYEMREAVEAVLSDEPIPVEQKPSRGCSIKWVDQ